MQKIYKNINKLVDIVSSFKGQPHYQSIVDIVTEGKYAAGGYDIIDPNKKNIVQQAAKWQYLECDFNFMSNRKIHEQIV